MVRRVSPYTRRDIYGTDGRSHDDNQAPRTSATRCTMICKSMIMRQHEFFWDPESRGVTSRTVHRRKPSRSHTVKLK